MSLYFENSGTLFSTSSDFHHSQKKASQYNTLFKKVTAGKPTENYASEIPGKFLSTPTFVISRKALLLSTHLFNFS